MKLSTTLVDYEQAIKLSGDNEREGPAQRRFCVVLPCAIEDVEDLAVTIAKLRAFATWLELQKART